MIGQILPRTLRRFKPVRPANGMVPLSVFPGETSQRLLCVLGCAHSPKVDPVHHNPVGAWVNESETGFSIVMFRPNGTGVLLAVGGGSAIGAPFTYSMQDEVVTIAPATQGQEPFRLTFQGDRLAATMPDKRIRMFSRVQDNDPKYGPYIEDMNRQHDQ